MSPDEIIGIAYLAFTACGLLVVAAVPAFRTQFLRTALRLYVENPLRLITGRRRPDHARIARLERSNLP